MNNDFLKEKAKYMPTPDLLNRLKEVKNIRDRAEEEYIILATELYGRTITYDKPKVKKRGVRWK